VALGSQAYHRESKFFTAYWKNVVRLNAKITKTNRQLSGDFESFNQPSPPVTPTPGRSGRRASSAVTRTGSRQDDDRDATIANFTTSIMDTVKSTVTAALDQANLERQQQTKEASRMSAQNDQTLAKMLAAKDTEHLAALQAQQAEQRGVERTSATLVQKLQSELNKLAADKFDKAQAELIQERKDRENDRDKATGVLVNLVSTDRTERKEREEAQAKRDTDRDAALAKERTRTADFLMEQSMMQQKLMGGIMMGLALQGKPNTDLSTFFQSPYQPNQHANLAHVAHAPLQPQALLTAETSPASSQLLLTDAAPKALTQAPATPVAKPLTAHQTSCLGKMSAWMEDNEVGFDDDVLKGLIKMGSGCGPDILLLEPDDWIEIGFQKVAALKLKKIKEKAM
jgi:hypothetical protein